ncbi:ATP-binding region ATPase domain protein [Actinobacteria bacterium OK074]|nr:ATP-binding region ATPase domain protein [Actinobacteria bacterium OK074]
MSGRTSPSTPVTHRRRTHQRPPQAEQLVLGQVWFAVMAPLLVVVVLLGVAVVVRQAGLVSAGWLLVGLCGGMVVPVGVGVWRVRAVVEVVGQVGAAERQLAAVERRRAMDALVAAQRSVVWAAGELCRGGTVPVPPAGGAGDGGPGGGLEACVARVQAESLRALIQVHEGSQSAMRVREQSQSVVLVPMLLQLSRRQHALVGRAMEALDGLERQTEDPDQLESLFALDHLVTRLRRHVESLAVLGGQSLRRAMGPVSVRTVLGGAIAEVEQYTRVKQVVSDVVGDALALPGHVGPDVTHLLAELIENGTQFAPPHARVLVRAERVPAGLEVEVEDRALGLEAGEYERLNRLLADAGQVDAGAQVKDGRIGLPTAARIARLHGLTVVLRANPAGGTTATVIVPSALLVTVEPPDIIRASALRAGHRAPDAAAAASALTPPAAPVPAADTAVGEGLSEARPAEGAPRLPRRVPQQLPLSGAGSRAPDAAGTADPGLLAAFHTGMRAAKAAPAPGSSPAVHP